MILSRKRYIVLCCAALTLFAQIPVAVAQAVQANVRVEGNIAASDTQLFTCSPLKALRDGDSIPAKTSATESRSVETHDFQIGNSRVSYPILVILTPGSGDSLVLFPALLKLKVAVQAGSIQHLDGFQVQTSKSLSAGTVVPVLVIDDFVVSFQSTDGNSPMLSIFPESSQAGDRTTAINTWRTEIATVTP